MFSSNQKVFIYKHFIHIHLRSNIPFTHKTLFITATNNFNTEKSCLCIMVLNELYRISCEDLMMWAFHLYVAPFRNQIKPRNDNKAYKKSSNGRYQTTTYDTI